MSKLAVVGESQRRPDMPGKVSGRAQYAGDLSLPGMLHAKTKRSNVAHARIKRIDATRALAYDGVKAVLTHHDVPRVLHYGSPHPRSASVTRDQYILDSKVRYWGESVAVVAAVSEEIAEEALDLIEVEYEELPALLSVDQALSSSVRIHDLRNDNLVVDPVAVRRGDVEKGFKEADVILEGTYTMGRPTPAYMEPNVCVSQWSEDRLTMWISTQTPFMVRGILAEVLGLPLTKVRVLVEWSDHRKSWSTVGVSDNVIEASWNALVDAIRLELMRLAEQDDSVERVVEDYCWGV
jgi:xanthine dehydrogenase molybdenum-binding subunit